MWILPSYKVNGWAWVFLAAFLPLLAASGCGSSDLAKGQGTVYYRGKPLEHGRVGFYPRTGRLAFGEIHDGNFTLTTYKPNDGAMVGAHRVTIHCDALKNPKDPFSDLVALIPTRYQKADTSGLTAEVKAGVTNDFRFDVTD